MYRTYTIDITMYHSMYEYLEIVSIANTNMYNSGLFVQRQVLTGLNKEEDQQQKNEKEVLKKIEDALPLMQKTRKNGNGYAMPVKGREALSYEFLNSFFYVTKDENYFADVFPRKCAQQTLRMVCQDMKSFYASMREYKKNPSKFLGRPKLPYYKPKGEPSTFCLTNQTCQIKTYQNGERELQFPYYRGQRQAIPLGKYIQDDWRLKEVTVVPWHGRYRINVILDDGKTESEIIVAGKDSRRICAIDLGVTNFAAMSNNIGKPAMLFKGGVVLNANYHCTKHYGKLQSAQNSGTTQNQNLTKKMEKLLIDRANYLSDFIHKTAKLIITWCTENKIDTLVVGKNSLWKQNADLGKNTGKFEQIPYNRFIYTLEYLCKREGILFMIQEESYTSKASFLDNDVIPIYNPKDTTKFAFSGKRNGRLYTTREGIIINADLNGSANIGHKAFPEHFTIENCDILSIPIIVRHPDLYLSGCSRYGLSEGSAT